jgi:hypothetical protein
MPYLHNASASHPTPSDVLALRESAHRSQQPRTVFLASLCVGYLIAIAVVVAVKTLVSHTARAVWVGGLRAHARAHIAEEQA